ncbi:hypothetical protein FP2506_17119 [Fulvimarina pelagi HTCC2506]|uniref:Uncharacterized protein n=1 Tax=Fulvimarina pelagi HTCC2506 TaxID=314231 RepID=Q0G2K6_9HYPH|nr:hypothetical protein [Fulvimarina pelagi]EAU42175.1 hypothetical protein FP2506_17119 [Fulvimarina pelagi HTCC2506]
MDSRPCGGDGPRSTDGMALPSEPINLPDDEIRALVDDLARRVVEGSIATAQRPDEDPILRDFSPIISLGRSLAIRSGQLFPDIVAAILERRDYIVLREHRLPLTKTGDRLVRSNNFVGDVALPTDDGIVDHLDCDLIVIDPITRFATILECIRGTAASSSQRKKSLVRKIRTVALSARAALTESGIHVGSVTGGIYDRYGTAGYNEDVTISGKRIDEFFGADIYSALELFDEAVYSRLAKSIPTVLGPLLASFADRTAYTDSNTRNASPSYPAPGHENEPDVSASISSKPTPTPTPTDVGRLVSPLAQRELHRGRGRTFSEVSRRTH